jgi:hypothetical protein
MTNLHYSYFLYDGWLFAQPLNLDDEHEVVWRVDQECNEPS